MNCLQVFGWLFSIILILPIVGNSNVRYYACYTLYIVCESLFAIIIFPITCLTPRDPISIRNFSKILRYVTIPLGISWEIRHEWKLRPGHKAVIVANHQSMFDILGLHVLNELAGTLTVLAAKKLLYFFPWGLVGWMSGLLFIDRRDPKSMDQTFNEAIAHLNRKIKVWVFPEGTRNRQPNDLLPFKKGAFHLAIRCQVPIIPIVYSPYYFIDHKNKIFKRGKIIVSVLDEISVEGLTRNDVDDLMDRTRQKMSEEFTRLRHEISCFNQTN